MAILRSHYTYSRREYKPLSWIPELRALKERVEAVSWGIGSTLSNTWPSSTGLFQKCWLKG